MSKNINNILIPNVTKTSTQKKVDLSNRLPKDADVSEFKSLLDSKIEQKPVHGGINLSSSIVLRCRFCLSLLCCTRAAPFSAVLEET